MGLPAQTRDARRGESKKPRVGDGGVMTVITVSKMVFWIRKQTSGKN